MTDPPARRVGGCRNEGWSVAKSAATFGETTCEHDFERCCINE